MSDRGMYHGSMKTSELKLRITDQLNSLQLNSVDAAYAFEKNGLEETMQKYNKLMLVYKKNISNLIDDYLNQFIS